MRKYLILLCFYAAVIECDAQTNTTLDAANLIKLTQTADYIAFVKLTNTLSYITFDSTKNKDGSIFYFTRELALHGNTLACSTDAKLKIKIITFETSTKATYADMKKQLAAAGLKPSGISKGAFPEIIESEDFEGKGILASSAAKKVEDGRTRYEFTFFKYPFK